MEIDSNLRHHSRNFTLSPETTDYDSNCGDLDSLSNDLNLQVDYGKLLTSMPVLEDGLSSGHASDTENNITSTTTTTTVINNMDSEPIKFMENGASTDNSNCVGNNDDLQEDPNDELLREIQKLRDLEHNPYQQVYSAGKFFVFTSNLLSALIFHEATREILFVYNFYFCIYKYLHSIVLYIDLYSRFL